LILLAIFLLTLIFLSLGSQAAGTWLDSIRYPPPGKLKNHLHVQETGSGTACVILESGLAATSLSWVLTQPEIARFAKTVSYDRAGLGYSAGAKTPHSLHALLNDLHALVSASGAPCVLAGHSFGGLLVQAYAHLHPENVAALVLIDPVSLAHWASPNAQDLNRLSLGAKLCRRGAMLAHLGIVRAALILLTSGGRRIAAFIGRVSAGKGSSVMARLAGEVAKLPPATHPLIRAHWSRPRSFSKLAEYLEYLPTAAKAAIAMPPPLHIPMTILSAATATSAEIQERDGWIAQRPGGRHQQIPGTSHWIQLDRPDLVVDAIRAHIK
jgi:pimeloyl-ACP methyl ester carboxylesterase